jgi:RimJ/RimL family protein N-acetyltransferase
LKDRPLCTATAVEVCRTLEGVDMDIRRTPGTQLVNDHTGEVVSSLTQFQPYAVPALRLTALPLSTPNDNTCQQLIVKLKEPFQLDPPDLKFVCIGIGQMLDPLLIDVPTTLETQRLTLRAFRAGDGVVLHEALAESITHLREFLWFLPWVAEDPTPETAEIRCRSGSLLGSVGLHRTDWAVPKTEVGYWVRPSAAGHGFVSEGVQALVDWSLNQLHAQRVELVTDASNTASRRVAERCGFVLEGVLRNVMKAPDGGLRHSCVYARYGRPVTSA